MAKEAAFWASQAGYPRSAMDICAIKSAGLDRGLLWLTVICCLGIGGCAPDEGANAMEPTAYGSPGSGPGPVLVLAQLNFGATDAFRPLARFAVVNTGQEPVTLTHRPSLFMDLYYHHADGATRRDATPSKPFNEQEKDGSGHNEPPKLVEPTVGKEPMYSAVGAYPCHGLKALSARERIRPGECALFEWWAEANQFDKRLPDRATLSVIVGWRAAQRPTQKTMWSFTFAPPGTRITALADHLD